MSFIAAIALFAAVAGALATVRANASHTVTAADDQPRRAPRPGARDQHTVLAPTLGRAHVPSWG